MGGAASFSIELPPWASPADLVLSGPDAGEWAWAAQRVARGELALVDPHRPPLWPMLAAAFGTLSGDIALGAHLLNHLLCLALPLLVYGLARPGAGRGLALGAGLVVACCPPLVDAGRRLGADPLVSALVLGTLLAAWEPARGAPLIAQRLRGATPRPR